MQINRRDSLKLLTSAAATIGFAGISRSAEADIIIGAPNALTGGFAEIGQRLTWGYLLAADAINRNGGIKALGGAKLKVVIADTSADNPAQAASVTRRMIDQEGAVVLAGATVTAMTMAAQVEAEKSQVPILTASYADAIVGRGMKYTFKISMKASQIWSFAVESVVELMRAANKPPKALAIYTGSEAVAIELAKSIPVQAKSLGVPVVSQVAFQNNLSDPTVVVMPARRDKPDLIVLAGFTNDQMLILRALRGLGIAAPVISGGGTSVDSAGTTLGDAVKGIFIPCHWNWDLKNGANPQLLEAYKKAYPDGHAPPNNEFLGLGYAITQIIGQALEKTGSRDRNKIRNALATAEFTDLVLPAGKAAFDETGQNKFATGTIGEWIGPDEMRIVWPPQYRSIEAKL